MIQAAARVAPEKADFRPALLLASFVGLNGAAGMPTKRKSLSKKIRFEVFKRDGFKCQYCGKAAPEVVLHVDHIQPVSKGGDGDMMNLITACQGCNLGKSDIELSDDASIQKQRAMLDELSERREQLEMMLQWREGMKNLDATVFDQVCEAWESRAGAWKLNERGRANVRKWIRKFPLSTLLDAIETACDQYLRFGDDGEVVEESIHEAFRKISGIAVNMMRPPDERELYYIRGICRNRMYCNESVCMDLLRQGLSAGLSTDQMKSIAIEARNWTCWREDMEAAIDEALNG